jgi:hypothetical protein
MVQSSRVLLRSSVKEGTSRLLGGELTTPRLRVQLRSTTRPLRDVLGQFKPKLATGPGRSTSHGSSEFLILLTPPLSQQVLLPGKFGTGDLQPPGQRSGQSESGIPVATLVLILKIQALRYLQMSLSLRSLRMRGGRQQYSLSSVNR